MKLKWLHVVGLNGPLDYIMPTLALSALPIAFIARLTRSNMLEVLTADYIKTAKAKGLSAAPSSDGMCCATAFCPSSPISDR